MSKFEIKIDSHATVEPSRIIELYNSIFSKDRNPAQWKWGYADNPCGESKICQSFMGSRLIGHTAVVPLGFYCSGKSIDVVRSQDSFVHADFQRNGIFVDLVSELVYNVSRDGCDLVMGFVRDGRHSMPGLLKTGLFAHRLDVRSWEMPLPTKRVEIKGTQISVGVDPVFDASDVACADRLLAPFAIRNRRDLQYLNWRYNSASGKQYTVARVWSDGRLAGWVVAKSYSSTRSLDLVECILPAEPALVQSVIEALSIHFRHAGLERCVVWSMEHYPLHSCLLEIGFTAGSLTTHLLIAAPSERCSAQSGTAAAYYLAMGDSDVY